MTSRHKEDFIRSAVDLFLKDQIGHYEIEFNNSLSFSGMCYYTKPKYVEDEYDPMSSHIRLQFSRKFFDGTYAEIMDTVIHEVAHALVGPDMHHGVVWKNKCLELGGSGERTFTLSKERKKSLYKWHGICGAGHEFFRQRKTKYHDSYYCNYCTKVLGRSEESRIKWVDSRK